MLFDKAASSPSDSLFCIIQILATPRLTADYDQLTLPFIRCVEGLEDHLGPTRSPGYHRTVMTGVSVLPHEGSFHFPAIRVS